MGNVVVDHQVFMSHSQSVPRAQSIGTDGLATCVGIIALMNDNTVFCGHLPCAMSGMPANERAVKAKTAVLLAGELGGRQNVQMMYFATGNTKDRPAKWIIDAASEAYPSAKPFESNSICWRNGEVQPLAGNMQVVGRIKGDASEDGPFEIAAD